MIHSNPTSNLFIKTVVQGNLFVAILRHLTFASLVYIIFCAFSFTESWASIDFLRRVLSSISGGSGFYSSTPEHRSTDSSVAATASTVSSQTTSFTPIYASRTFRPLKNELSLHVSPVGVTVGKNKLWTRLGASGFSRLDHSMMDEWTSAFVLPLEERQKGLVVFDSRPFADQQEDPLPSPTDVTPAIVPPVPVAPPVPVVIATKSVPLPSLGKTATAPATIPPLTGILATAAVTPTVSKMGTAPSPASGTPPVSAKTETPLMTSASSGRMVGAPATTPPLTGVFVTAAVTAPVSTMRTAPDPTGDPAPVPADAGMASVPLAKATAVTHPRSAAPSTATVKIASAPATSLATSGMMPELAAPDPKPKLVPVATGKTPNSTPGPGAVVMPTPKVAPLPVTALTVVAPALSKSTSGTMPNPAAKTAPVVVLKKFKPLPRVFTGKITTVPAKDPIPLLVLKTATSSVSAIGTIPDPTPDPKPVVADTLTATAPAPSTGAVVTPTHTPVPLPVTVLTASAPVTSLAKVETLPDPTPDPKPVVAETLKTADSTLAAAALVTPTPTPVPSTALTVAAPATSLAKGGTLPDPAVPDLTPVHTDTGTAAVSAPSSGTFVTPEPTPTPMPVTVLTASVPAVSLATSGTLPDPTPDPAPVHIDARAASVPTPFTAAFIKPDPTPAPFTALTLAAPATSLAKVETLPDPDLPDPTPVLADPTPIHIGTGTALVVPRRTPSVVPLPDKRKLTSTFALFGQFETLLGTLRSDPSSNIVMSSTALANFMEAFALHFGQTNQAHSLFADTGTLAGLSSSSSFLIEDGDGSTPMALVKATDTPSVLATFTRHTPDISSSFFVSEADPQVPSTALVAPRRMPSVVPLPGKRTPTSTPSYFGQFATLLGTLRSDPSSNIVISSTALANFMEAFAFHFGQTNHTPSSTAEAGTLAGLSSSSSLLLEEGDAPLSTALVATTPPSLPLRTTPAATATPIFAVASSGMEPDEVLPLVVATDTTPVMSPWLQVRSRPAPPFAPMKATTGTTPFPEATFAIIETMPDVTSPVRLERGTQLVLSKASRIFRTPIFESPLKGRLFFAEERRLHPLLTGVVPVPPQSTAVAASQSRAPFVLDMSLLIKLINFYKHVLFTCSQWTADKFNEIQELTRNYRNVSKEFINLLAGHEDLHRDYVTKSTKLEADAKKLSLSLDRNRDERRKMGMAISAGVTAQRKLLSEIRADFERSRDMAQVKLDEAKYTAESIEPGLKARHRAHEDAIHVLAQRIEAIQAPVFAERKATKFIKLCLTECAKDSADAPDASEIDTTTTALIAKLATCSDEEVASTLQQLELMSGLSSDVFVEGRHSIANLRSHSSQLKGLEFSREDNELIAALNARITAEHTAQSQDATKSQAIFLAADTAWEKAKDEWAKAEVLVKATCGLEEAYGQNFNFDDQTEATFLTTIKGVRDIIGFAAQTLPKRSTPHLVKFAEGSVELQTLLASLETEVNAGIQLAQKKTEKDKELAELTRIMRPKMEQLQSQIVDANNVKSVLEADVGAKKLELKGLEATMGDLRKDKHDLEEKYTQILRHSDPMTPNMAKEFSRFVNQRKFAFLKSFYKISGARGKLMGQVESQPVFTNALVRLSDSTAAAVPLSGSANAAVTLPTSSTLHGDVLFKLQKKRMAKSIYERMASLCAVAFKMLATAKERQEVAFRNLADDEKAVALIESGLKERHAARLKVLKDLNQRVGEIQERRQQLHEIAIHFIAKCLIGLATATEEVTDEEDAVLIASELLVKLETSSSEDAIQLITQLTSESGLTADVVAAGRADIESYRTSVQRRKAGTDNLAVLERQIASTIAQGIADAKSAQENHDEVDRKCQMTRAVLEEAKVRVRTLGIIFEDFARKIDLESPTNTTVLASIKSIHVIIDFAKENLPRENNPFVGEFEDGSGQLKQQLSRFADELDTDGHSKHRRTAQQLIVDGRPLGRSLHLGSLNGRDDRSAAVKQTLDRNLHRLRLMNGSEEDDSLSIGLDSF